MNQFQSFAPQAPSVAEYAFPSVLQFLQSEWRRFERDRNEWDIEKAGMKARIAFLEGEKRGVDNTKMDLMKRVKMLEYALRQERSKYVEANNAAGAAKQTNHSVDIQQAKSASNDNSNTDTLSNGNSNSNSNSNANNNNKAQNRMSAYSASGVSMTQVSPTSATGLDPVGRAKSREFLRICLQEISYLTASVPQSITTAMPPAQSRVGRHELDKRVPGPNGLRGGGGRNRHSDFFPAGVHLQAAAPPLSRSNSVPIDTLDSLSRAKVIASSPLHGTDTTAINGSVEELNGNQATLKQQHFSQQPSKLINGFVPDEMKKTASAHTPNKEKQGAQKTERSNDDSMDDGNREEQSPSALEAFQREEAVTVVHSPVSGDQWRAELEKAGRQLAENANEKKAGAKAEDVAQLSKDVQDKFNITSEQLNKMVKSWDLDKSKQDPGLAKNSIRKRTKEEDELESLWISESESMETSGGTKTSDALEDEPARWRPKLTLRRHLDTVRSIAFHPSDKALLSGSEDGTMKCWNLEAPLQDSKRQLNGEIEPVHTYRGHTKPVTAVAISADQNKCFSSSMDSTVRSWKMVPMNKETYARLDPSLSMSSFIGHTDTVWDIRLFPISISSSQLLASISADGALKIWDTETKGSPLRSSWGYNGLEPSELTEPTAAYTSGLAKLPTPTSLDFCPTDLRKMVVSYSNAVIKLFDIETGKEILAFKSNESYDGTTATQINKIVCHPTLPIVISGHEDRYIRFFDINSGSCSFSMLAHLDAVSSLDIDPSGLVLCSGGHDGSVRLWDIGSSTRSCLQEFTGHRRKSGEGVMSVKYHSTLPGLLATGGADSIVKVYTRS
ncbi:WD40-repeat-containing domain protein [Gamsiella multidivaricata]|uniref:WD40-repeat-containing domain protein n=1 Tax=Gamsiella multidivaricata TaxID=101098 RepID=UPI0022207361|nr:WD40-repeat-containing domain protein [Gamsiella multidivaricata]KAI7823326.1 WD40-repeat-containing domain protein [Gamsiella multidivaricata]